MDQKEARKIPRNASRQAEEEFLREALAVIRANLKSYGDLVSEKRAEIDEMLEHFHDDNPELINLLENTITLHDHMKRALERNERARNKPYFGRIDFYDESLQKEESIYIGRGGISRDATHQLVIDWRAPVANAYYENGLGECSYPAPDGKQIPINLELKRTYEIEDGKLIDYFDSEVIANDDLLTKYLAKNKQAVLGEIVATIQKEQNEIIRKSPYHNIIVQGVAGSGKTTVAMHRISFILYNYQDRFRPEDFYIIGSNRILLNYITGVLPDLDVHGVRQMTMEELFVRLLYEDWDEKRYRIKKLRNDAGGSIRGGLAWFRDLKAYCDQLERDCIPRESIYLNPRQFVEGLRDGKSGVYDESGGKDDPRILLVDKEAVERYIRQNPKVSLQSKINMLNDRLLGKVKEEFLGKGVKYTEKEKKAILKAYRGRYGGRQWKGSIYRIYREFLEMQIRDGKLENCFREGVPDKEFDVYDLAALAYLYKRIKETEVISEAHHIIIDEAQDYGMMAYSVLHFCIYGCTYTVMGDVSQNIHFGMGLNDWEELRGLLLPDEMDSFGILKKSYRNTVEISDFATDILHHGKFSSYPVEPIIRHGESVCVRRCAEDADMFREAADICRQWLEKGFDTIAVICRDQEGADRAARELSRYVELLESSLEKAVFGNGIMVLPVEYTKGLEFDTVLILNPTREEYPVDDGHAKLLYVAATRALHELCVLHGEALTDLIAEPPQNVRPVVRESRQNASSGIGKAVRQDTEAARRPCSEDAHARPAAGQRKPKAVSAQSPAAVSLQSPRSVKAQGAGIVSRYSVHAASNQPKASGTNPAQGAQEARKPERTDGHSGGVAFGDIPATEKLRIQGHAKIDLSVRWVTKQPDGLYLQSRYGTLRLSPVGSAIMRVTFKRNGQPGKDVHPGIAVRRAEKFWMYKDAGSAVELTLDELALRVDKSTGAISYMRADERNSKRLLLAERGRECRLFENARGGQRALLFLDWVKDEHLYSFGSGNSAGISLRGGARYITPDSASDLPFILSDKGYAILMAASSPVFCCDTPAYGSYLCAEDEEQLDYYLIAGKRRDTLLNAYRYLCGK